MWSRSGSTSSERSSRSSYGARDLARPDLVGQPRDHPEDAQATSDETIAAASTPSFASSSWLPSKARLEIRSETVKPMPGDGTAPGDHRPAQGPPQAAEAATGREPRRAEDAERLADHVAEHDSERDRRR